MIGVQELIHKLEEGAWARWIKWATALLGIIALTVWYDYREFRNFHRPEAMEAAQLARNLARGQGYTTQCHRPLTLFLIEHSLGVEARLSRRAHPDLVNPPIYPLLLAGLMKVAPFEYQITTGFWRYQPEVIIAVFNQVLFFLMAGLAYRLARRLFDPAVAFLTAVLLVGADLLWRFSISGLPTTLLLLQFTGLAWALVRLEESGRAPQPGAGRLGAWAALAGLLLGLGGLTSYSFLWLVIPAVWFCLAYLGPRRGLACGVMLAVMLAVATPWLARNYHLSSTLFGVGSFAAQQETPAFMGGRLEQSLAPDFSRVALEDYLRKLFVNTAEIVQNELPKLGGSWVTAFFLVGLLLPFRNPALGRLRAFVLLSLAVLAVAQAITRTHLAADPDGVSSENLLVLTAPLVFMFGVALFHILLDQLNLEFPEARRFVVGAFACVGCGAFLFTLLPPRYPPIVYPPYMPPWIQEAAQFMRTNELIMSDMPWAVAWYGDRPAILTSVDAGRSFYAINDEHKAVSALYLTTLTTDARFATEVMRGRERDWARFAIDAIVRTNLPARFPLQHARLRYLPDQLFVCDRPRWQEVLR